MHIYISLFCLFVFFFWGISSAIKLSQESSLTCLKSKKCWTVKYRNCPGILARVYTGYKYPVYPPPQKKKHSHLYKFTRIVHTSSAPVFLDLLDIW